MTANSPAASYKYHFVSELPEALKCLICLEVAEEPWQHGQCGRLFCEKCLQRHGKEKTCPACRGPPQYFKDNRGHREIKALPVKCGNNGCSEVIELQNLQQHARVCEHALISCKYASIGCKEELRKRDMAAHEQNTDLHFHMAVDASTTLKRRFEEAQTQTATLQERCLMLERRCTSLARDDATLKQKLSSLDRKWEGLNDKFTQLEAYKCAKLEKKCATLENRCATLEGNSVALGKKCADLEKNSALLEVKCSALEKKCNRLENTCVTLEKNPVPEKKMIRFKFVNYHNTKMRSERVISPSYYISPNGYHMALRVFVNGYSTGLGTHVSAFANVVAGKYDAELKWPFVGKITFTLMNQLEDKNHHQMTTGITADCNLLVDKTWGFNEFIPHSELGYQAVKKTQYLKDDTLYFRMSVEVADSKPWLE